MPEPWVDIKHEVELFRNKEKSFYPDVCAQKQAEMKSREGYEL